MVVDEEKLETETDTAHLMNLSVFAANMLFEFLTHRACGWLWVLADIILFEFITHQVAGWVWVWVFGRHNK